MLRRAERWSNFDDKRLRPGEAKTRHRWTVFGRVAGLPWPARAAAKRTNEVRR
jgi:hypothetical protein